MDPAPQHRFTGMADVYARSRPDYPQEVLAFLSARCGLHAGSHIVDIGSGTGISSRWLARAGWTVTGIEPNDDMRRKAQDFAPRDAIAPTYHAGTGEATGLDDGVADLIVCAQAFHWLDPAKALPEFHRILKAGGWAALIWNERDESDAFTADFGRLIRRNPESVRTENARQSAWKAFLADEEFADKKRTDFRHHQVMDEEDIVGRALSMSHVPRDPEGRAELTAALHACFTRWQRDGAVVMHYQTAVFTGQNPQNLGLDAV